MARTFTRFTLLLIILAISARPITYGKGLPSGKPNKTTVEKELKEVYEKLLTASKNRDEKVLREVLTDGYSQVTGDGKVRTKETRINETMSPDNEDEVLTLESFQPHIYNNAAVALCKVRNKGTLRGEAYDVQILSTVTFVREGKAWRIAATHLSLVK